MNHQGQLQATRILNVTSSLKVGISVVFFWTLIAAYFTTVSLVFYSMRGIPTDWFHLSLNHFSKAALWIVLTPLLYYLHRNLIRANHKTYFKIVIGITLGLLIAIFHVFSSWYLDLSFRNWIGIIDLNFWTSVQKEFYLLAKGISNSFIIYILIMGFFVGRHYFCIYKDQKTTNHPQISPKNKTKEPLVLSDERFDRNNPYDHKYVERSDSIIPKRIIVKSEGKMRFIQPNDIRYVESYGNYLRIQLTDEKVVTRDTLKHMLTQLSSLHFYRINRSVIVNVDYIRELEPWFNGEYTVRLTSGHQFNTGRAFREHMSRLMSMT